MLNKFVASVICLIMLVMVMCVPDAEAYAGGLLNGKVAYYNDDTQPTNLVTDNDESTGITVSNNVAGTRNNFVSFPIIPNGSPDLLNVTSYRLKASGGTWQLKIYRQGALVATENVIADGISHALNYSNVTFFTLVNMTSVAGNMTLYEFDVFGTFLDKTPPAVPTGLQVTAGNAQATLKWNAVTDSDLASYKVYKNGVYLETVSKPTITYTATGLTNGTSYAFSVSSVDLLGNESSKSSVVNVTPVAPIDTTPPTVPLGLSAVDSGFKALVSWTPNSDGRTQGYYVWMNGSKFNPGAPVTGSSIYVNNLTGGSTYTYQLSAVSFAGFESAKSNSVSVIIAGVMSVNFVPNKDSIAVQVTGGKTPYTVTWDDGTDTFTATKYTIEGLLADTDYTVTVTDDDGTIITQTINTGNFKGFNPPVFPDPLSLFQQMVDNFGEAGTIGVAIIIGAVALGIICILGIWGWRLSKRWLFTSS